jgi:hypothetical protein
MKRHSKKFDIATLLKNKNVLYIVLFLSVANLFSYLMLKKLDAVAFFIIIGFLTTYFSKNMIVVMLTAMLSTFILVQINLLGKVQEGMESSDATSAAKPEAKPEVKPDETTDSTAPASPVSGTTPIPGAARAKIISSTTATKAPEKFTQKLSPARYNADDDDDAPRHKPKVDYAATLESAYDNLDKLLGSDAIRGMTEDTGRLAEKQKLLMGNIEKMTPVMEKAGSILQSFDMGAITKLMENIGNNASALQSGMKPLESIE